MLICSIPDSRIRKPPKMGRFRRFCRGDTSISHQVCLSMLNIDCMHR